MSSKKRKLEEEHHVSTNARLKSGGMPTLASTAQMPVRSTTSQYDLPKGSQRNPFEIESSPENKPNSRPAIGGLNRASSQLASTTASGLVIQKNDNTAKKPKYYAVAGGHAPGVYNNLKDAKKQISGFTGAKYQKFDTEPAALEYLEKNQSIVRASLDRQKHHLMNPVGAPPVTLQPSWEMNHRQPSTNPERPQPLKGSNHPQPSKGSTHPQPPQGFNHPQSTWETSYLQSSRVPDYPHTIWEAMYPPPVVPQYSQSSAIPVDSQPSVGPSYPPPSWETSYQPPPWDMTYQPPSWETSYPPQAGMVSYPPLARETNYPPPAWDTNHLQPTWRTRYSQPPILSSPVPPLQTAHHLLPQQPMAQGSLAHTSTKSKAARHLSPYQPIAAGSVADKSVKPKSAQHVSPHQPTTEGGLTHTSMKLKSASHISKYQHMTEGGIADTSTKPKVTQSVNPVSLRQPSPSDFIATEPEPTLSSEQRAVVDLILQGHNVFYTGSAGCGKSTILKAFVRELTARQKRVKIIAPTNLAALNVNGQTTWNYAGWTPDSMKRPLKKLEQAASGREVYARFDSTDVLVIDEISMVENLVFERLNCIMKSSLGNKFGGGAFGGVQVIVTGDLAPVKPFKHCIGCGWELVPDHKYRPQVHRCENRDCNRDVFYDIDKWAFRSDAWKECKFKHINLTEIHRQHDKKFISILQRIRKEGVILPNHANILVNHTSETEDAIKLFSRRDDVERTNNENISRLSTKAHTYQCLDHFDWKAHHKLDSSLEKNAKIAEDGTGALYALKDHRYEVRVQIKKGMRVVLQANLDPENGLVNGSQGSVIDFEPYDPSKLPKKTEGRDKGGSQAGAVIRGTHALYAEQQIREFGARNMRQPWPIVKFDNGLERTIYADCTANELGNEEPYSLLSRTQIPLMAGYAITVHKSQGMTLDRVIVDLSRAFEPSQIYVALSRARSLKGLKVIGLPLRPLGGTNPQVKEFWETHLNIK